MAERGGNEIESGGPAHHVPCYAVHAPVQHLKFTLKMTDSTTEIGVLDSEVREAERIYIFSLQEGIEKRFNKSSNNELDVFYGRIRFRFLLKGQIRVQFSRRMDPDFLTWQYLLYLGQGRGPRCFQAELLLC